MSVHVEEWVTEHGRALGDSSKQDFEADHAMFAKLWSGFVVGDEDSAVFLDNGLKAGLIFNSNNTSAK